MSNTAYQRGVADMEAAGVNPAMVYSHGAAAGASTPSGSSANSSAGSSAPGGDTISSLINSAANLAGTLNNDKTRMNDVKISSAVGAVLKVASFLPH